MSKPSKADLLIYKALNKAIEKDQLRIYLGRLQIELRLVHGDRKSVV